MQKKVVKWSFMSIPLIHELEGNFSVVKNDGLGKNFPLKNVFFAQMVELKHAQLSLLPAQ